MPVTQRNPMLLLLTGVLVAALFAGALAIGRSGGSSAAPTVSKPAEPVVQTAPTAGPSPEVAAPPASAALPKLAHPKPSPTETPSTPVTPPVVPVPTAAAPTTPSTPSTPSNPGGSGGGGTIISG